MLQIVPQGYAKPNESGPRHVPIDEIAVVFRWSRNVITKSYKGIVREISQAPTPKEQWGGRSQVEYLVKIEILDSDAQLKPGMSSVVDIITNKKDNALTLGHEFIQKENENYFVVLKNGQRQNIKVGLQNESVFEILEGLSEGQEVQQVDFLKLIENQR